MTPTRLVVVLATLAIFTGTAPASARKLRGCSHGRFVVTEGEALRGDVLVVDGSTLRVEGHCPAVGTAARAGRRGTKLAAAWDACAPVEQLRLRATTRDCSAVRGTLRVRTRRTALVAMPSACGDGVVDTGGGEQCDGAQGCAGGMPCSASCRCDGATVQPLECDGAGYPCTWGEVAASVRARSIELADAAAAILADGGSTSHAVDAIRAASPAELALDEHTIRFRLQDGRPVWITGEGTPAPGATARPRTAARVRPRAVVSPGTPRKTAYVLDPYAWEPGPELGVAQAAILEGIEGYAGNVVYEANTTYDSDNVGLIEFRAFSGYNVVIANGHATALCDGPSCHSIILAQYVANPTETGLGDDEVGAEFVRAGIHGGDWAIALGADFFRYRYPAGLHDALVVFAPALRTPSDIADALEGANTNFVAWTDHPSVPAVTESLAAFLRNMGQGRSIAEVIATMGDELQDPLFPSTRLAIGPQDIRIRELPRLIDAITGQTLDDSSTIEIVGYPDDDEPDSLLLLVEVAGADEARAGDYIVVVSIDGAIVGGGPLVDIAQSHDGYVWTVNSEIALGFDVHEGQSIDILAQVALPEGGVSSATASPTVVAPAFEPGRVWQGTASRTFTAGGAHIIMVANVTFERDPSQPITSSYPRFQQKSGTLTWTLENAIGGGVGACVSSAPTTSIPLGEDEYNSFVFDLTGDPVEYHGSGFTQGPPAELTIGCSGPGSEVTTTSTGGQWFSAPMNGHYTVGGNSFSGTYTTGGQQPSTFDWSFTKVE